MADADPRLVAAATALAMTDLRRSGKTAPAVLERVLPHYMRAAEVCVSAYLATPAELGSSEPARCICDRDTLADNMATPGCPVHAPPFGSSDPVPDEVRAAQDVDVEEWAERMGAGG